MHIFRPSWLVYWLVGWLVGFHGISTFVGYLMPDPFLYKHSVLLQTIQFSLSTEFNCQKTFLFQAIQFIQTVLLQPIQFSISTDLVYSLLNVKTIPFQII